MGCHIGKDLRRRCGVEKILSGCPVEKDPEGLPHGLLCQKDSEGLSIGTNLSSCGGENDSERLPCQKDSKGFCGVKNLMGCCIEEDSEVVSC